MRNSDEVVRQRQQYRAETEAHWAGISDVISRLVDKAAGIDPSTVIKEEHTSLDETVENIVDPVKRAQLIQLKEEKIDESNIDVVMNSLFEASTGLNEAIEALDKPIILDTLRTTEFEAHKIKRLDSPLMKLLTKTILEQKEKSSTLNTYFTDTSKYNKATPTPAPKPAPPIEVNKAELEMNSAMLHFKEMKENHKNTFDNVVREHAMKVSQKAPDTLPSILLQEHEPAKITVEPQTSYTEGYMDGQ